jgi:hypothetical protein
MAMGTVHKFKRPPKNEQQFRGYRPQPAKGGRSEKPPLRDWQKSVLVWSALVTLATGFWAWGLL